VIFAERFTVRDGDEDECISALLDVASASDFTLKLMRKCGCAVDYVKLDDHDRVEIAAWVNARVEEFADYERDMAQERLEWVRADRAEDMRKAEGE
jgi:hypothetical protein